MIWPRCKTGIPIRPIIFLTIVMIFGPVSQPARAAQEPEAAIREAIMLRDEEAVREQIRKNPDIVNIKDPAGTPILHKAAYSSARITRVFLEHGADPNARDKMGNTALHLLYAKGQPNPAVESVRVLTAFGTLIDARNNQGQTALQTTLMFVPESFWSHPNAVVWELVKQGADVNARGSSGKTPLYRAIRRNDLTLVKFLLGCGADPGLETEAGYTALHWSLVSKDQEIAEELWKYISEPDIYVCAGLGKIDAMERIVKHRPKAVREAGPLWKATALHWAARRGHHAAVQLLVRNGSEGNAMDRFRRTPLHYAAVAGHVECAQILVENGATLDSRDNWPMLWKLTPLQRAAMAGEAETAKVIAAAGGWDALSAAALGRAKELAVILAEEPARAGGNVAGVGLTPLCAAAYRGQLDTVRLLLDRKVPLTIRDQRGWTALYGAAEAGHVDVLKALIEAGAKPNVVDKNGKSALYAAAINGHSRACALLVRAGADPEKAYHDRTPLGAAAEYGRERVVNQMLADGADPNGGKNLPILGAVRGGHLAVVKKLLQAGADVDWCAPSGTGLLRYALSYDRGEIARQLLLHGAELQ